MDATADLLTVEDYYAVTVEGDHKELVAGVIVVNEPQLPHAFLQAELTGELFVWTRNAPGRGLMLPPIDVRLDEHNLFGPDIVWIAEEHRPERLEGRFDGVPDLCVEIRSPGTWRRDIGAKKAAYERGACPELWLVDDRARSVIVYRRSRPDVPIFDVQLELAIGDELSSPQLPGFALPLERLFRDL